jgi:WD40 repeat protein
MVRQCAHLLLASVLALSIGESGPSQTVKNGKQAPSVDVLGEPLPAGAVARLGTTRFRHGYPVTAICLSPDGKLLASAGGLWVRTCDASTGIEKRLFPIEYQLGGPHAVAFSPDGKTLAAATHHLILLWDVSNGLITQQLSGSEFKGIAFSPDGKVLATMDLFDGIIIWDVSSGARLAELKGEGLTGPGPGTGAVVYSPDGRHIAASRRGDIFVWDTATLKQLRRMKVHDKPLASLTFSPDGRALAAGSVDGTLVFWDAGAGKEIKRFRGPSDAILSVAISPDGKRLASGSGIPIHEGGSLKDPHSLRLWDVAAGKEISQLGTHPNGVGSVVFSRDGSVLIASAGEVIRRYDLTTGQEIGTLCGHVQSILAIAFAPDGKSLVSASADHTIRIWDPATSREVRQLVGFPAVIDSLDFSSGGGLLSAASRDGVVRVWDMSSPRDLSVIDVNQGRKQSAGQTRAVFSPDGTRLASLSQSGPVTIWDVVTSRRLQQFGEGERDGPTLAYSPDGKFLVTGTINDELGRAARLWNLSSGQEGPQLAGNSSRADPISFSPDGEFVVAVSSFVTIHLWQTATGKILGSFKCAANGTLTAVISPDGKMIATTDSEHTVRLWESHTGKERCRFVGHLGSAWAAAFSPSGDTLATGGSDTTVLIWDVSAGYGRSQNVEPSVADFHRWWGELAGDDAAKAYQAMWSMIRSRNQAVAFLREHLQPTSVDNSRVAELLTGLSSDRFATREQAMAGLKELGEAAEPALRQALATKQSPESFRRIEELLQTPAWPLQEPARRRALRSIEVLEHLGLAGVPVLEQLAAGPAEDRLTKEARKSISRITRRKNLR